MLRIEVTHTFDVSVPEAFAYITDMKNWPEYWPDFIRIENPAAAGWSNPGDRATVVIKLLNRERALNMELEAFQKDACVTYVSRQRGLPDVRHERHFEAARDGCVYRLSSNTSRERVLRVSSIGRLSDDPSSRPCERRCKTSIDFFTSEEQEREHLALGVHGSTDVESDVTKASRNTRKGGQPAHVLG